MIAAYDFETTNITEGTPRLKYITAFGDNGFKISKEIGGDNRLQTLCDILELFFLIPDHNKAKFVAWNGNNFDVYFIASALLKSEKWILQPFMTASKAMRGLRVKSREKVKIGKKRLVLQFQFLDGISMTGMVGKSLASFLKTFAPELPKLSITCPTCGAACDFEGCKDCKTENIEFNPKDKKHIQYAERDSEGLYIGMVKVQRILKELTKTEEDDGMDLKPTIGNIAVRYFMNNIPDGIELKRPNGMLKHILHGSVKRGGFCWCQRPFKGKVWKYDINQAYAAAMRDAALPCGDPVYTVRYMENQPGIYLCRISRKRKAIVPFYYKVLECTGRFTLGEKKVETWLTSIEVEHLRNDQWTVEVTTGFYWTESFNFSGVVDRLETLRATDPDGPSGPLGTMVKALGNNAYGKTLETLNGVELIIANDCPDGFNAYDPFNDENAYLYSRNRAPFPKNYHVPQIGVFVTAHVRCFVRDTANLAPKQFIYSDTDCVVFSKPVNLKIHKTHYGDWKIEADGVPYIIIGKKIYYGDDGSIKAKGLRTKKLEKSHYENWIEIQPEQEQTQKNNFLKYLAGHAMFKTQKRGGTNVQNSDIYKLKNGKYIPT